MFKSIRRTPYQSLGSFMILFFTLFMALFFFNLTSFFDSMLSYVETRPQVIVYFDSTASEEEILDIKGQIEATGKTTSVTYVSQAEALSIYEELNEDNPLLLEMVSEQILPASLEIYARRPEFLAEIAQDVQAFDIIDEVEYQEVVVERLFTLTRVLRQVAIGIFAFLLTVSIIVLLTMTAFKISVKRDEIEVLQLIGASKWYIRKPFLAEGLFFGFTSATLAFFVYYGIFLYFQPYLGSYLAGIPRLGFFNFQYLNLFVFPPSLEFIGLTYVLTLFFGLAIGYIGNYLATSKYIK